MRILAVDPGTNKSAWVRYNSDDKSIKDFAIDDNETLLTYLYQLSQCPGYDFVFAIEKIQSFGMPVGGEIFDTVFWSGRFWEAATCKTKIAIPRITIKNHICHTSRAKDSNIRQAIIDMYGGKAKAIGLKKTPGPLYGFKADLWAALAVAITAQNEMNKL